MNIRNHSRKPGLNPVPLDSRRRAVADQESGSVRRAHTVAPVPVDLLEIQALSCEGTVTMVNGDQVSGKQAHLDPRRVASRAKLLDLPSTDPQLLGRLVDSFPDNSVFRIINEHMVETALELGTDKGKLETVDSRRIGNLGGYDVWGVEENLAGLSKADVFCGFPKALFCQDVVPGYSSEGLGIPSDRSAILVFDGELVESIPDTDGYRFRNPSDKKSALRAVIRFAREKLPHEKEMERTPSLGGKATILETMVRKEVTDIVDVNILGAHLSLDIGNLLYDHFAAPEAGRLQELSSELNERVKTIELLDSLQNQLDLVAEARQSGDERRMKTLSTWPSFVHGYAERMRKERKFPIDFSRRLEQIIARAAELERPAKP
jgi:hypothetical protein